uniref:ABC transporter ATP-binding protein n=1 Tax=Pedobacter schmidteae TaxID=2201271 RepID=UPI0018D59283|nr:ABC transporter ATP-binding protein [Pedobacter schmidteae]
MILEVKDLTKVYGDKRVVNIENLQIGLGETIGLVGNNGAGKTTFFRMILDLIRPSGGSVLSKGENVMQSDNWKNYTASFLDEGFLIDYLTPEEYFLFIGSLQNLTPAFVEDELKQYGDFFNGEILNKQKYIRDFSKGNQNKVGIAAALLQNPEILILDEPFANLDPTTQIRLKALIKSLKQQKAITTLISSHDLNHVTDVCDRIILLEKGKVIKDFHKDENTLMELEAYFSEQQDTV